jgi:hypothetical protein
MATGPSAWRWLIRRGRSFPLWCTVLIGLIVSGCSSSPTTPVGPLGSAVDLRPSLPPAVAQRFPTDEGTTAYTVTKQACGTPARIQFNWRVVRDGNMNYVLSYDAVVLESAPSYQFALTQLGGARETFPEANQPISQIVTVSVSCVSRTFTSASDSGFNVDMVGDGSSK